MQGRRQFVIMPAKFNDKAVDIIMLWFKNLMVYRLSREISLRAEEMEKQLASLCDPIGGTQPIFAMSWLPHGVNAIEASCFSISSARSEISRLRR